MNSESQQNQYTKIEKDAISWIEETDTMQFSQMELLTMFSGKRINSIVKHIDSRISDLKDSEIIATEISRDPEKSDDVRGIYKEFKREIMGRRYEAQNILRYIKNGEAD